MSFGDVLQMLTNFDRTAFLYFLVILFGTAVVLIRMYRKRLLESQEPLVEPIVEVPEIERDPVVNDLISDLFIGQLTGYVIGLIDGNEQELRYYHQLLDIIYNRFVLGNEGDGAYISVCVFIHELNKEFDNIPSDNLRRILMDRLLKLVKGIEATPYYTLDNKVHVDDIYDAGTQCFNIIKHYDVIAIRQQ